MDQDLGSAAREIRRLLVLAVVFLGLLLLLHFSPLRAWLDDIQALKGVIDRFGFAADAVFAIGSIFAIAVGVPRLALCGLAGALFGFVEGALVSLVSSVLGSYGAFLLARWGGRAWAERKLRGASPHLRELLADPSIGSIFVARQMPMPGLIANVLLGVLPVRHQTFLAGTFAGYLPSTAIVALAGSSLGKESLAKAGMQISLSMIGLAVLSVAILWIVRRFGVGRGSKP